MTAVAEALDYAHERDLLHRDIKPANILLAHPESGDQRILLADFGIARWVNDISGLTATNMTVGTVSYAAPEQLMGATARRAGGSIRVGGHRLSPVDRRTRRFGIRTRLSSSASTCPPLRPRSARAAPSCPRSTRCWPRRCPKTPTIVIERCADFARALAHRLDGPPTGDVGTILAPAATPPKRSLLRAGVVVPAILAVLLIVAITLAVMEFRRADRPGAGHRDSEVADRDQPDVHAAASATGASAAADHGVSGHRQHSRRRACRRGDRR